MPDPLSILQEQFPPVADSTATIGNENELARVKSETSGQLESWKDSPSVMALSAHLKQSQGIRLVQYRNGLIGLHFISGISPENEKRWSQALKAWDLLVDSLNDLAELIRKDLINLDVMDAY